MWKKEYVSWLKAASYLLLFTLLNGFSLGHTHAYVRFTYCIILSSVCLFTVYCFSLLNQISLAFVKVIILQDTFLLLIVFCLSFLNVLFCTVSYLLFTVLNGFSHICFITIIPKILIWICEWFSLNQKYYIRCNFVLNLWTLCILLRIDTPTSWRSTHLRETIL